MGVGFSQVLYLYGKDPSNTVSFMGVESFWKRWAHVQNRSRFLKWAFFELLIACYTHRFPTLNSSVDLVLKHFFFFSGAKNQSVEIWVHSFIHPPSLPSFSVSVSFFLLTKSPLLLYLLAPQLFRCYNRILVLGTATEDENL